MWTEDHEFASGVSMSSAIEKYEQLLWRSTEPWLFLQIIMPPEDLNSLATSEQMESHSPIYTEVFTERSG